MTSTSIKRVKNMSNTLINLQEAYGPLMTYDNVAKTFYRSKQGLRSTMCTDSFFSNALKGARKKYGRRTYFLTQKIAELIDSDFDDSEAL